jgi:hypothetical protein
LANQMIPPRDRCPAQPRIHSRGHKPTVANDRFAAVQHDCARPASEAIGLRTPPPLTIDYDMALRAALAAKSRTRAI